MGVKEAYWIVRTNFLHFLILYYSEQLSKLHRYQFIPTVSFRERKSVISILELWKQANELLSACRRVRDSWVIAAGEHAGRSSGGKQSGLPGGRGTGAGREQAGPKPPHSRPPRSPGLRQSLTAACQPAQREAGPADPAATSSLHSWRGQREGKAGVLLLKPSCCRSQPSPVRYATFLC